MMEIGTLFQNRNEHKNIITEISYHINQYVDEIQARAEAFFNFPCAFEIFEIINNHNLQLCVFKNVTLQKCKHYVASFLSDLILSDFSSDSLLHTYGSMYVVFPPYDAFGMKTMNKIDSNILKNK